MKLKPSLQDSQSMLSLLPPLLIRTWTTTVPGARAEDDTGDNDHVNDDDTEGDCNVIMPRRIMVLLRAFETRQVLRACSMVTTIGTLRAWSRYSSCKWHVACMKIIAMRQA